MLDVELGRGHSDRCTAPAESGRAAGAPVAGVSEDDLIALEGVLSDYHVAYLDHVCGLVGRAFVERKLAGLERHCLQVGMAPGSDPEAFAKAVLG